MWDVGPYMVPLREKKMHGHGIDHLQDILMAWDVLCNCLDLEFCFRKEEAAQQVHELLISAVARVDYCNHNRVIAPSLNGGALPRLTPRYGSMYNGD